MSESPKPALQLATQLAKGLNTVRVSDRPSHVRFDSTVDGKQIAYLVGRKLFIPARMIVAEAEALPKSAGRAVLTVDEDTTEARKVLVAVAKAYAAKAKAAEKEQAAQA